MTPTTTTGPAAPASTPCETSETPTTASDWPAGTPDYTAPEHDPRPYPGSSRSRWADDPDDERERLEELGVRRPAWMVMEHR